MTVIFKNNSDVIVYALEKIVSFARENQYLFVANCVWWIAGIIGLDSGLTIHIDNLELRRQLGPREVSTVSRDIARSVSADSESRLLEEETIRIRSSKPQQANKNPKVNTGSRVMKLTRNQRRKLSKRNK
jgi:hypothetical protein